MYNPGQFGQVFIGQNFQRYDVQSPGMYYGMGGFGKNNHHLAQIKLQMSNLNQSLHTLEQTPHNPAQINK